jgi:hypothetical protein
VEVLLSRRYGADGLDKLDVRRLFEQVAGRAGGERPAQVDHVVVGGQDKHPSVRAGLPDPGGGGDAAGAGEAEVHGKNAWPGPCG